MSALSITSETNNKYQLWKKISQKESKLTPPISCLKQHWHSIRNQTYTTCQRETIGTGTKKKENLQKSVVQSETKLTQVNCQKPLPIRSKININQLFEKTSHQANRLQQFRLIWNKGTWTEPQPSIQHSTNIFFLTNGLHEPLPSTTKSIKWIFRSFIYWKLTLYLLLAVSGRHQNPENRLNSSWGYK